MSDDVAAVLAATLQDTAIDDDWLDVISVVLKALTANHACVLYVPEGVEVAHGARLVPIGKPSAVVEALRTGGLSLIFGTTERTLYAIEVTP